LNHKVDVVTTDSTKVETSEHLEKSKSDVRRIISAAIALFITFACWSFSNPPGTTPDEWFHLGSIWCSAGVNDKSCMNKYDSADAGYFIGEAPISDGSCIFHISAEISSCHEPEIGSYYINYKLYPPIYYRTMHELVTPQPTLSVLLIRLFNSLIAATLLAIQLVMTSNRKRLAWLTGFTFTLLPMSIFLISSVNPSGWAMTGLTNSWMFLLLVLTGANDSKRRKFWLWILWLISTMMVLASRYDAFLYLLASNFVIVVSTRIKLNRLPWKKVALGLLLVAVPLWLTIRKNILLTWLINFPIHPSIGQTPTFTWISHWIVQTIAVPISSLGTEPLGQGLPISESVRVPDVVWIVGVALLGSIILFSLIKISVHQFIFICGSYLAILFAVLSFNGRLERDLFNMSGRYVLPMFPFIVGYCIFSSKSPIQLMEIRSLRFLAISLLTIIHTLALHAVIETFVDGQSYSLEPIHVGSAGWWWSGLPIGPNFVVLLGSITFFWFLTFAWSTVATVQVEAAVRSESHS